MRILFISLITTGLLVACGGAGTTENTPEAPAHSYVSYGDTITADAAINTVDLMARMAQADSFQVKVEGEIIASCAKKGCWMTVQMPEGKPLFVKFRDYGFFVPKEGLEGKFAIMEGQAKRTIRGVDMLRHYAEDAGKTPEEIAAITAPDTTWSFMADGVLIRQ